MNSVNTGQIVKLNIGGVHYDTLAATLTRIPDSLLSQLITNPSDKASSGVTDDNGRLFIDRDGKLFRYVLDFYRYGLDSLPTSRVVNLRRLRAEADYFKVTEMANAVEQLSIDGGGSSASASCITVGYRGTFGSSRDSGSNLRFRKMSRILIAGQAEECRRVFGENVNDTRDPDSGNAYSSRLFLKHTILEHAFDTLYNHGYRLVSCCASSTNGTLIDLKGGQDEEEARWQHYNEFIFVREYQ